MAGDYSSFRANYIFITELKIEVIFLFLDKKKIMALTLLVSSGRTFFVAALTRTCLIHLLRGWEGENVLPPFKRVTFSHLTSA